MPRNVVVDHSLFIAAPPAVVRSQFADIQHHIDSNVHPRLRFELLAQEPQRARFRQEVKLLGMRQSDVIDRRIDEDGTIHDESIDGFNKGARLDFRFTPASEGGTEGTRVAIRIELQTPPFLGFLAPLLKKQVLKETMEAAEQDKKDIEGGYKPSYALAAMAA